MKRLIWLIALAAPCGYAHAGCPEEHSAEMGSVVVELEEVTGRMESYVAAAEGMHDLNGHPETILPVLEQFMTTLESEFNDRKDVYNSLDIQYDCDEHENRVHAVYRRVTDASVAYAELKFELQKRSRENR